MKTIFGHKLQMGEVYEGVTRIPVTAIKLVSSSVTQTKTVEKDGYAALQVKLGNSKLRREVEEVAELSELSVGQLCTLVATSKGKGYSGGVKRWGFAGGPRTHGQSDRGRAPGSISRGTTPGRVLKGKKMAGHMGTDTVTVRNVKVLALDLENHKLAVSGAVPGARAGLVTLTVLKHV
jgi:large subunit ribosomal protein L3